MSSNFLNDENKGDIVIYQSESGKTKIDVRFQDETVWLTQAQLCELYQSSKANVSEHIKNIFEEGELEQSAVVRKIRTTAADGKTYAVNHYNLDMIISLGYRIKSSIATQFRRWATERMFMAFNAYRGQFSQRASSLIDLCMQLRMLSLHNERLSEIVFSEPEKELPARAVFSQDSGAKLEIKNLSYQYDPFSQPIFSNINITVEPGESVALIGPSGVGKTTLLKVMCGLLSPTSGDVLADNLDITKIGLNNYRLGIACVLQEDRLFSGSLIDNISGFEDNADLDFVMECAKRCNIHDEIMKMPMGYETIVGELGLGISGGQKQRILIARALYRRPSILFMDEATSHLDLKNESVINQSISALSITRIIVAHRPSTIASADRIIDLSQPKTIATA